MEVLLSKLYKCFKTVLTIYMDKRISYLALLCLKNLFLVKQWWKGVVPLWTNLMLACSIISMFIIVVFLYLLWWLHVHYRRPPIRRGRSSSGSPSPSPKRVCSLLSYSNFVCQLLLSSFHVSHGPFSFWQGPRRISKSPKR